MLAKLTTGNTTNQIVCNYQSINLKLSYKRNLKYILDSKYAYV